MSRIELTEDTYTCLPSDLFRVFFPTESVQCTIRLFSVPVSTAVMSFLIRWSSEEKS